MNYVHTPHTETLPSARERIAKLRSLTEATLQGAGKGWTDHGAQRLFMLDVAAILLDAMKHGPDNPIVRDIPGRSQMQEQGPAEGVPHTGHPDLDGIVSSRAAAEWERFDAIARTIIRDQGLWVDLDGNWHVASGGICMRPNPDGSLGN